MIQTNKVNYPNKNYLKEKKSIKQKVFSRQDTAVARLSQEKVLGELKCLRRRQIQLITFLIYLSHSKTEHYFDQQQGAQPNRSRQL